MKIKCDFLILQENILHPSKDSTEFFLIFFASKSFVKIHKFEIYEPQTNNKSNFCRKKFFVARLGQPQFFFILSGLIFMDQHIFDFSHVFNFADFPIFVYENAEIWAKPANKKE